MASKDKSDKIDKNFSSVQALIPMTRVRTIMKSSPEITTINQDTLFIVCKATELFIRKFCMDAYKDSNKSSELDYKKLADLVSKDDKFQFLSEIVPFKVKAKEALKDIEIEKRKSMK